MTKTNIDTVLSPLNRLSVADSVFDELHRQILTLELQPGAKISEADVAKALGVSRQPVRDAFYRLSKLGFLSMRPQVATTVSLISKKSVQQAPLISAVRWKPKPSSRHARSSRRKILRPCAILLNNKGKPSSLAMRNCSMRSTISSIRRSATAAAWTLPGSSSRDNKAHMDRGSFPVADLRN